MDRKVVLKKTREYLEKVYFKNNKVPKRLWNNKKAMLDRYNALYSLAEMSGANFTSKGSILDVGCGTGESFSFFQDKKCVWKYTGLELFEDIANRAREGIPVNDVIVMNVLDYEVPADWVWVCGIVTFNIENWEEHTHKILSKCFDLCNKGVMVDFLKDRNNGDRKNSLSRYVWPSNAVQIVEKITPYYNLKNDYRSNSFCIALLKKKEERIFSE